MAPSEVFIVFQETSNFPQIWFWDLRFRIWVGVSFIIISQLQQSIELKVAQVGLFVHNVELHQVSLCQLVFDNYQIVSRVFRSAIYPKAYKIKII